MTRFDYRFEFRVQADTIEQAEQLARDLIAAGHYKFNLTVVIPIEPAEDVELEQADLDRLNRGTGFQTPKLPESP